MNNYPNTFQLGRAEYDEAVDMWLNYRMFLTSSEIAVVQYDYFWQYIFTLVASLEIFFNDYDSSSQVLLRPNTVFMKDNMLSLKGETGASIDNIHEAFAELIKTFM